MDIYTTVTVPSCRRSLLYQYTHIITTYDYATDERFQLHVPLRGYLVQCVLGFTSGVRKRSAVDLVMIFANL